MSNYVPLPDGPVTEGVLPTGQRWAGVEIDGLVYFHVQGLGEQGMFVAPTGGIYNLLLKPPTLLKTTADVELFQLCVFAVRLSREKEAKDNATTP